MNKERIYFPGLNGIRAIAALLVVCSHISIQLSLFGFKGFKGIDMAGYGVTMFFVLSGYLITYLLLTEYNDAGALNYRKFYIRRILRIWPIYFLAVIVSIIYMIVNGDYIGTKVIFYILMLTQFGGALKMIYQLWSVGVEEQFYLFWPWLFKKREYLLLMMIGVIVAYMAIRIFLRLTENGICYMYTGLTRFDCMAIGGIGALAIFEKWTILKYFYKVFPQIACWLILIISVYRPFHIFSIIDNELYALIFLVLIINVSTNIKSIITLENPLMNWLGRISYGIYVYHVFALTIVLYFFKIYTSLSIAGVAMLFLSAIALTLIFAQLSYVYFEKYFLNLKYKFSIILSGGEVAATNRSIPYRPAGYSPDIEKRGANE